MSIAVAFSGHGTVYSDFIMATYAYIHGRGWLVEYRNEETGELLVKDPSPMLATLEATAAGEASVIEHATGKAAALEEAVLTEARAVFAARRLAVARSGSRPN
jgi:hypothetical protein